jgi:hypothetical protein
MPSLPSGIKAGPGPMKEMQRTKREADEAINRAAQARHEFAP